MANKIVPINDVNDQLWAYAHWCEGCDDTHAIPVSGRVVWTFNSNLEKPTFGPSVRHDWPKHPFHLVCHYFIRDGQIEYCSDSTHAMAGKTVELKDREDWYDNG